MLREAILSLFATCHLCPFGIFWSPPLKVHFDSAWSTVQPRAGCPAEPGATFRRRARQSLRALGVDASNGVPAIAMLTPPFGGPTPHIFSFEEDCNRPKLAVCLGTFRSILFTTKPVVDFADFTFFRIISALGLKSTGHRHIQTVDDCGTMAIRGAQPARSKLTREALSMGVSGFVTFRMSLPWVKFKVCMEAC